MVAQFAPKIGGIDCTPKILEGLLDTQNIYNIAIGSSRSTPCLSLFPASILKGVIASRISKSTKLVSYNDLTTSGCHIMVVRC